MFINPDISNLSLSRYVPFIIKGTVLAVWYDNIDHQYLALCPKCHELITYDTLNSLNHELVSSDSKCCQGCRAKITFERNPGAIWIFLDFWYRTGNFPQSSSWLEAIPHPLFNLWAKEIRAGLEADLKKPEKLPSGDIRIDF